MALQGNATRMTYSGAVNNTSQQGDPLLSLGGCNPDNVGNASGSRPYRRATLDLNSTVPYIVNDTQTDGVQATDPAIGDWLVVLSGAAGGSYGKVIDVDYGVGDITVDRDLGALPLAGDVIRTVRNEYVFPDITPELASAGTIDHRMLYQFQTNGATLQNNYRFWVEPVKPNGCDIELYASGGWELNRCERTIATGTDNPFRKWGTTGTTGATNSNWTEAELIRIAYSIDSATPSVGSGNHADEAFLPVWLRRTVPPTASPGECVFILWTIVPDSVAQDATSDPVPFAVGLPIVWTNPQPTYTLEVAQDRTVYVNGGARILGRVTDDQGVPVAGLNAWIEQTSGPGSLANDLNGFTDSDGRITATYTAPNTLSTDPEFRLVVPTNPEV